MRRLTLTGVARWPENEYEGELSFTWFGQPIEARVIGNADDWAEWRPGVGIEGEPHLEPFGPIERPALPMRSLTRHGPTLYTAVGVVVAVLDAGVVLDVGFPLLASIAPEVATDGEVLRIRGQLDLALDPDDPDSGPHPLGAPTTSSPDPDDVIGWARLLRSDIAVFNAARGAEPARVRLVGVDLRGLDLRAAWLERCDLTGADLRGASVNVDRLCTCRLEGTLLEGLQCADPEPVRQLQLMWDGGWNGYRRAVAPRLFPLVDLSGAQLGETDLTGMMFAGGVFRDADLSRCRLLRTRLAGCDLRAAHLGAMRDVDLAGADLRGATLSGPLVDVDLRGADLRGANLRGATLDNVRFSKADLSGADLREAQLEGVEFVNADLRGARLEGVVERHCVWRGSRRE